MRTDRKAGAWDRFLRSNRIISDLSRVELVDILNSGEITSYYFNVLNDVLLKKLKGEQCD